MCSADYTEFYFESCFMEIILRHSNFNFNKKNFGTFVENERIGGRTYP